MKKWMASMVCMCLCMVVTTGCVPEGTMGQANRLAPASSGPDFAAVPQVVDAGETPQNPVEAQTSLKILLPQDQEILGTLLTQQAKDEGIALVVQYADATEAFASQALAALSSSEKPDLFYVENQSDANVIGSWIFEDLSADKLNPTFGALTDMVPKSGRLLDDRNVYGLPLGYYAEGYLVDIEMLAALLGTPNTAMLIHDLNQSTWAQWSQMLAALEIYLQKPASMRIHLGEGVYHTPGYRPRVAQPLRGIFSFADGTPATLMRGALDAAVYAPYGTADDYEKTEEDTVRERLFPSLESLYALLDFETLHMARPEGAMFRGESYMQRDALAQEQAAQQFGAGTALLYRADSRTGLALEKEYPRLQGKLALLPVKLPPPVLNSANDSSQSSDSTTASSASVSQEEQASQVEETTAQLVAAAIEKHNVQLWYGTKGYLCLNAQSANKVAARSLLMRFFTTEESIRAISEQLYLHPFSDLLPVSPLSRQVGQAAIYGEGARLPASGNTFTNAEQNIGAFVAEYLMDKEEWGEEQAYNFLVTSLQALGFSA